MDIQEEIRAAFERLSAEQRASLLASLRGFEEKYPGVAEPRAVYKTARHSPMTVEEYLKFDEESRIRHEYVAGEIFAMCGSTVRHGVIAGNLVRTIGNKLHGGPCRVFFSDYKVRLRVDRDDVFYYPDVAVSCDTRDLSAAYLPDPKLIIEVLSPSTEATDRREKAMNYRQILSLDEYAVVAQRSPEVTIYRRADRWAPEILSEVGAVAEFRSIELRLPLAQIYADAL